MIIELKEDEAATDRYSFDCELKFAPVEGDVKDGTIDGYGAVFDLLDKGGDIIRPGAFKASIADWKKKKAMPAMLWQHQCSTPIGLWVSLEEDEKGLKVGGEIIQEVPQGAIAYALLKRKAIKGLSIGYRTIDADIDRKTGARHIKKAELWEISLVTFPMMPEAAVTAVKGDFSAFDPRVWEKAFRDEGLSATEAKAAVAAMRKQLAARDGPQPEQTRWDGGRDLLMSIRAAAQTMRGQ